MIVRIPPDLCLKVTGDSKTYILMANSGSRPTAQRTKKQPMPTGNLQYLWKEGLQRQASFAREDTDRACEVSKGVTAGKTAQEGLRTNCRHFQTGNGRWLWRKIGESQSMRKEMQPSHQVREFGL